VPERRGVDRERFRDALASVCTPVAVVTSFHEARPHGSTVSAFCSLSLDPPLVIVSLARDSDLLAMIRGSGRFGINVLTRGQDDIAARFARKGRDKFDGLAWDLDRGLPRVRGAATWLVCRLERLADGGDHEIVVGLVEHADARAHDPLLYQQRAFTTLVRA
jgi:flavin reductase (DIM6/NTAB) family NADH-FMN oxidoreductase RutF